MATNLNSTHPLLRFMDRGVSNFLAVEHITAELREAGFTELHEAYSWDIEPGGRYYVTKNGSAVMAFVAGTEPAAGFGIIAAHSDSPGFRIKPRPVMECGKNPADGATMVKLNTEVYGGAIWHTWFDRPLGISGRVILKSDNPVYAPHHVNVRIDDPRLIIPHLAIHFNRQVNSGLSLSAQKDMLPVFGYIDSALGGHDAVKRLVASALGVEPDMVLDYDLTLFDVQPALTVGADGSWINSGRLDDLAMAWCALEAIKNAPAGRRTRVMAIFDNEETGSGTKQGAHSPLLRTILRRVCRALGGRAEDMARAVASSFFISADCAHAYHPNYPEKMDPVNHPMLGGGPVIKVNANCKYMTDADSAAAFRWICDRAGVPCQEFVNHSDSPGGSTLGNILTSQLPMRGVDMGIGLWAMHSVRETASLADVDFTVRAFSEFYSLD